jgi:hypothetical protein
MRAVISDPFRSTAIFEGSVTFVALMDNATDAPRTVAPSDGLTIFNVGFVGGGVGGGVGGEGVLPVLQPESRDAQKRIASRKRRMVLRPPIKFEGLIQ